MEMLPILETENTVVPAELMSYLFPGLFLLPLWEAFLTDHHLEGWKRV